MFEQYTARLPVREAEAAREEENLPKMSIDSDSEFPRSKVDVSSLRMMIENLDDDTVGNLRIASYGDTSRSMTEIDEVSYHLFMLGDYRVQLFVFSM
jgi:hypothetical protein